MDECARDHARWAVLLVQKCRQLHQVDVGPGAANREVRAEAWMLLHDALLRFLRSHAHKVPCAFPEDLEDLASTKALDLVQKAELGRWTVDDRTPGELGGYLSTVARNALLDLAALRNRGRPRGRLSPDMVDQATSERDIASGQPAASAAVEAAEFTARLMECVEELKPRARRIWLMRVLYDLSSREIAEDPSVSLPVAHVHVILQRARDAVRTCMGSKGFEPRDLPPGTFVCLWESLEALGKRDVAELSGVVR